MIKPQRIAKYFYFKFIRLKGDPWTLARGTAVGIFVGSTPTIPLHTVLTLLLAFIFRGSKVAALLASVLFTNPFMYYLSWRVGNLITHHDLSWERIRGVMEYILSEPGFSNSLHAVGRLGQETIFAMLLAGCLLALPIALLGYILSLRFFIIIQKKRQEKHLLK